MSTLADVLKKQRALRKLDTVAFAVLLSVSEAELAQLEAGEATVSNDRAEYWAQLLKLSRVALVQLAIEARARRGVRQIVEDVESFTARTLHSG